jgi:hypothetical protein
MIAACVHRPLRDVAKLTQYGTPAGAITHRRVSTVYHIKAMNKKIERLLAAIHANPKPFDTRATRSPFEFEFAQEIGAVGGIAVKDGWPDFGVYGRDHHFKAAVETKPEDANWAHPLQVHQLRRLIGLASLRVPSFIRCGSFLIQIDENGQADQVEMDALTRLL